VIEILRASDEHFTKFGQVYLVGDNSRNIVRAFHVHKVLWDWFFVSHGSAKFALVDGRRQAPTFNETNTFILSDRKPQLLVIAPGFYHGWMSLEDDTQMISTASEVYNREDKGLISLTRESLKIFENLSEELSYDIEFEKCGGLVIRSGNEAGGGFLDTVQFEEMGIKVELADNKQLKEIEPYIYSKACAGATFCRDEGQVNPINLTIGFALAAQKNGAELLTGKEVEEIEVIGEDGLKKIKRAFLDDGTEIVTKEVLC